MRRSTFSCWEFDPLSIDTSMNIHYQLSFWPCDAPQWIMFVCSHILLNLNPAWNQRQGVLSFSIVKSQDVNFFLPLDVVVDIDWEGNILLDEDTSLAVDDFEVWISSFLSEHNILKGGQRFSDFLRIVSFFILFTPIFSLISVWVVLSSFFDLVLRPLLVIINKKDFFDLARLNFYFWWKNSCIGLYLRASIRYFSYLLFFCSIPTVFSTALTALSIFWSKDSPSMLGQIVMWGCPVQA